VTKFLVEDMTIQITTLLSNNIYVFTNFLVEFTKK